MLVAYHRLPYSFKCVAKPDKESGLLDDRPVDAPVPPLAGPSSVLHTTANTGGTVHTPSQRSAPEGHHMSIRRSISPPRHPPQWETVESRPPSGRIGSRTYVQQPEPDAQPLLLRVAPIEGPTRGGLNVVLIGTNFPSWPTILYARFGSAVAATVSHSVSLGPSHSKICSPG